jgi:hypothetical protein
VIAVGSTCTTAGLLAGLQLARAIGVWRWPVPIVHGVRVTPWPVTSRLRTADLARRTLARGRAGWAARASRSGSASWSAGW